MASAKQKAWRKKFAAMAKSGKFRKKSTRKGQVRKTARRAFKKVKRKTISRTTRALSRPLSRKSYKRKKSSSGMKMPKIPSVIKKVAIGVGAASLAGLALNLVAPQFAPIGRPIAALAAGGIPGVAGELLLNQGLLGSITGMFGGAPNVQNGGAGL